MSLTVCLIFRLRMVLVAGLLAAVLPAVKASAQEQAGLPDYVLEQFGAPPAIPDGPLSEEHRAAVDLLVQDALNQSDWVAGLNGAMEVIAQSGDPRLGWLLTDMMGFAWRQDFRIMLGRTARELLEVELTSIRHRAEIMDYLIAWDIPAYPGYLGDKRAIYVNYVPAWDRIFAEGNVPWHLVSWGGVDIDARPYDTTDDVCHCIPAADNPTVTTAQEATWLSDDAIVFGIEVNGEYRAYPRRIMEVREMVNDTLGGRDLGIPYCTLCGAAQAYFTDEVPFGVERPILRTSGLLVRSNKLMYDVRTYSVFDTFTGEALTGPLAERGIALRQAAVVTTDWGSWRRAHPETTVLAEELALGRDFDLRNTRDANGPIFPVGDVDPRLPVHEDVVGVITASGAPVAFQRSAAFAALSRGQQITVENIRLQLDAGGVRAVTLDGEDAGSHQAFWFAWAQFHPETVLWTGE